MQKLSKFTFLLLLFLFLHINYYILNTTIVYSQEPFPELKLACDQTRYKEFHSLRPYQAAHCGDANKALYCSNSFKFVESFNLTDECPYDGQTSNYLCYPNYSVGDHDLVISLDDSMFPIMGNTEEVKNGNGGTEVFDDATKVNEYASWYLSGVNNRAEYGENTNDRTVNYSGPVQKLLPKVIQEAERVNTINKATVNDKPWTDDDGKTYTTPQNHNQIVACAEKKFWFFGPVTPTPCYKGSEYRLGDWKNGGLGIARDLNVVIGRFLELFPTIPTQVVGDALASAWDKRTPPLPWDDGTVENPTDDNPAKPFTSEILYQKAYNEWKGKTCVIVPIVDYLICIDLDPTNVFVNSEWSEMYQYIPLSNTTDKKGNELIKASGGVIIRGSGQTEVGDDAGYDKAKNAPLYFAHTQEVKESSELLNKTFTPLDCPVDEEGNKIPDEKCELLKNSRGLVEKNDCSVVNVRVNKGDNLFPGDPDELQVQGVHYTITQVLCEVTYKEELCIKKPTDPDYDGVTMCPKIDRVCNAEVTVTINTDTKTPNVDEIFDSTVAGTGSTFRKIFPKVEEGAPVSCIADMPTVTDVTYDAGGSQPPPGGDLEFTGVIRYPEDGAGDNPQLTFPHVGSVYEYFLKGIQTALRPKGYGESIVSGKLCSPTNEISCSASISSVAEAYKVPECQLTGIMMVETDMGVTMGSDSCTTEKANFSCCNGAVCGPAQIMCSQYDDFTGDERLDMCEPNCASELLARALLLKKCQAAGDCQTYDWSVVGEHVIDNYSIDDGDYTEACYFYGLPDGCHPTACSQYRWGPGKSYGDAVAGYCGEEPVVDGPYPEFCAACAEEDPRVDCSQYANP